ncbi:tripartite tricarboxylate transporter TctB family protein [Nocardioides sp. zg-1228]|uniref:tripartite tricarboxylate transporter TctB family protein n=1 Tax=Nocardioides sp. zg-1228 TaxID=2763008 RepID=UPI0016435695|nr:tripartite tricarboxylate transporter TctB family protein [Nocardioides sp. zg-1228]MBC2935148.1 tripartite tricarboxylate transporter TctB family protein [Nocardioides sp. zg-1228]QSF56981.1 tripartite tricarboxylate transporter TctB family protein [Nocardioides sp. zg-1228]
MSAPARRIAVEEAVAYGFLTAIGGYATLTAFDYPAFTEGNRIGPGLLPAVFGGLITLISAGLLVSTLTGHRTRHDHGLAEVAQSVAPDSLPASGPAADTGSDVESADSGVDIFGRTAAQRMRQLQIVTVALVVALLLVPVVGLLGALGLFSLFASIVVERRPWLSSVIISAVSVLVIYLVFSVVLNVPLPAGAIGIGG